MFSIHRVQEAQCEANCVCQFTCSKRRSYANIILNLKSLVINYPILNRKYDSGAKKRKIANQQMELLENNEVL